MPVAFLRPCSSEPPLVDVDKSLLIPRARRKMRRFSSLDPRMCIPAGAPHDRLVSALGRAPTMGVTGVCASWNFDAGSPTAFPPAGGCGACGARGACGACGACGTGGTTVVSDVIEDGGAWLGVSVRRACDGEKVTGCRASNGDCSSSAPWAGGMDDMLVVLGALIDSGYLEYKGRGRVGRSVSW